MGRCFAHLFGEKGGKGGGRREADARIIGPGIPNLSLSSGQGPEPGTGKGKRTV